MSVLIFSWPTGGLEEPFAAAILTNFFPVYSGRTKRGREARRSLVIAFLCLKRSIASVGRIEHRHTHTYTSIETERGRRDKRQ